MRPPALGGAFARSEAEARARLPTLNRGWPPFAGDPRVVALDARGRGRPPTDVERFRALYAAALAKRRGLLPDDAGGFDACLSGDEVVFVAADRTQREVGRLRVSRGV